MPLILCPVAKAASLIKQNLLNGRRNVAGDVRQSEQPACLSLKRLLKCSDSLFFILPYTIIGNFLLFEVGEYHPVSAWVLTWRMGSGPLGELSLLCR